MAQKSYFQLMLSSFVIFSTHRIRLRGKTVGFSRWTEGFLGGQCKVEMQSIWACPKGLRRALEPPVALMTSVEEEDWRSWEKARPHGWDGWEKQEKDQDRKHRWHVQVEVRVSHSKGLRLWLSVDLSALVRDVPHAPKNKPPSSSNIPCSCCRC